MKPERWREIERLYQAALERAASGREAFLREACGADDDLRREVESLLESNDEAGSFIERPAIEVAAGSVAEEVDRRVRGDGLRSPDHPQSPGHSRESVNPALQPGAAVSHYRIVERIGAGGMGVVYRAEDTTLKRQVALKFLPEAFAQDADRLSRFKREAQVLASLNHPNIASIYGLEEAGGVLALVMELVEGKTLAGRIQSGAIPLEEALPLAKQIAEALEAAHDKGIIHRDLKPANIKITPERAAKVLDFGLAKVLDVGAGLAPPDRAQQALPLQNAPTLSTAATETGMILGTAGYMSPEQAKGQRVDRRADIWAFGCVLFEMISGRKAFEGETMPETLAAVLKSEPDWSALGSDTPPPVQALIRRCLVKDPKQRLQAIGDARITIEETISGVFSADSVAASLPPTDAQTTPLHSWRRALPWARVPLAKRHEWVIAGVVVAVAILAAVAWGLYSHFAQQVSVPFQNFTITQITDSGDEKAAAISPDGKYILSVRGKGGLESLWLRNVPTGSDTQIIAPAAAAYSALTFSPDGNYVYYRKAAGPGEFNLFRAPVLGGTPRLIVIDIDTSITFSPDGQHIAYWRFNDPVVGQARLLSASLDGSGERTLLVKPVNALYYSIAWSPDGRRIAWPPPGSGNSPGGITMFDVASKSVRTFATFKDRSVGALAWMPDGSGLLVLYQSPQTEYRSQIGFLSYPGAKFSAITRDTNSYPNFTISADDSTIATIQQNTLSDLNLLPSSGNGESSPSPVFSARAQIFGFSWDGNDALLLGETGKLLRVSADGKTITTLINQPGSIFAGLSACPDGRLTFSWGLHGTNEINVWRANADGSDPTQLTQGKSDYGPVCSAGGEWVYYFDAASPAHPFRRVRLDGGRPQDVPGSIGPGIIASTRLSLSSDGKQVAYVAGVNSAVASQSPTRIALVRLGSGRAPRLIVPDSRFAYGSNWSGSLGFSSNWAITLAFTPDGKALAYPIRQNGGDNVWVQPLDGARGRQITHFTSEGILKVLWSPDGKHLAVLRFRSNANIVLLRTPNPSAAAQ